MFISIRSAWKSWRFLMNSLKPKSWKFLIPGRVLSLPRLPDKFPSSDFRAGSSSSNLNFIIMIDYTTSTVFIGTAEGEILQLRISLSFWDLPKLDIFQLRMLWSFLNFVRSRYFSTKDIIAIWNDARIRFFQFRIHELHWALFLSKI